MTTKTLIQSNRILDETNQVMQLDYYLLSEYDGGLEQYGAGVVLRRGTQSEQCSVSRITPLADRVMRFIETLAENNVTATSFWDVLSDLL